VNNMTDAKGGNAIGAGGKSNSCRVFLFLRGSEIGCAYCNTNLIELDAETNGEVVGEVMKLIDNGVLGYNRPRETELTILEVSNMYSVNSVRDAFFKSKDYDAAKAVIAQKQQELERLKKELEGERSD